MLFYGAGLPGDFNNVSRHIMAVLL